MNTTKRITTIALIIFFLLVIIYSIYGVVATYFIAPNEFGNTLKDAGSSLFTAGGDFGGWLLVLTVGWSIGWFVYSLYRRKNKLPQDTVVFHTFIALTFFLALVSVSEILSAKNASNNNLQILAAVSQSISYIAIGIALMLRKRLAVYLFVASFIIQLAFYSIVLKPTSFPQITIGILIFGTIAWFILFRRNWNQLH